MKSSVDDIRRRFDADVERFSNLETGQSATVDAPLAMALVAQTAAATAPHARPVLPSHGRLRLRERRLEPVGDEVEHRAAVHLERLARAVGEHEQARRGG